MFYSCRRKAQRFKALDDDCRRLVLSSALLLPLFWARVKLLGRWELGSRDGVGIEAIGTLSPASLEALKLMGQLVNDAAHIMLPPDNCLTRSLVLQCLLRRRGVPTNLRLGVQLVDGRLLAHAWVEFAGTPINDSADVAERYPPFERALSRRAAVAS